MVTRVDTNLAIEQVDLDAIHPAPWNVRTGHAVSAIAESIRVNGFRDPIEAWRKTGEIVAGEGRYLAARHLGLSTVPVVWHEFDSLASAKRYAIANNRLTDRSHFELEALRDQLEELGSLAGTGYDDADFPQVLGTEGEAPRQEGACSWDRVHDSTGEVQGLVGDVEFVLSRRLYERWLSEVDTGDGNLREGCLAWFARHLDA